MNHLVYIYEGSTLSCTVLRLSKIGVAVLSDLLLLARGTHSSTDDVASDVSSYQFTLLSLFRVCDRVV